MDITDGLHINESEVILLDQLPWEDVIYQHLFQFLGMNHLFHFRGTSRTCKRCVNGYFTKMKKLRLINVGPKFTWEHFKIITEENYQLRSMNIRNAKDWLSDDILIPVIENSENLQYVDLSQTTTITNRVIQRIVINSGKSLHDLILRECHWLTNETLNQIAINCPQLQKLDITGCWDIQDKGLIHVAMLCKELSALGLARIYGLTDQSICHIAKNLRKLKYINIQGCWRVTDHSMLLLIEYCKELKIVHVKECRDISMSSVEKMQSKGIKVDVLFGTKHKMTKAHLKFMKGLPM